MALARVKIIMADSNEPYLFGDLSCFNFQLLITNLQFTFAQML